MNRVLEALAAALLAKPQPLSPNPPGCPDNVRLVRHVRRSIFRPAQFWKRPAPGQPKQAHTFGKLLPQPSGLGARPVGRRLDREAAKGKATVKQYKGRNGRSGRTLRYVKVA